MATPRSATPATTVSSRADPAQADAERSMAPAVDPATTFAVGLSDYIFNAGFCHQQWADVQVSFFNTSLRLHRLILARSPYLARLLTNSMPGGTVQLLFTDENITEEAVYIAIQHLYNPSLHLVSPTNARAVLATAYLFGAMTDLEERAYTVVSESLSPANIGELVHWLGAGARIPTNGFAFGAVQMPVRQPSAASSDAADAWGSAPALYGEWSVRLRAAVLDYLLRALPAALAADPVSPATPTSANGSASGTSTPAAAPRLPLASDSRLLAAFVPLPFELFKQCVESPELPIPFMQDRFAFAKRAIAQRKKLAVAQAAAAGGAPPAQFEEGVVLALRTDGGDGMTVHVTRKPKRSRGALWKVEG